MKTVIVIGGGASGLVAALSAAADKQNRVLLLERQQRLGRKLLATGNGRCNLTNTAAAPAHYHGAEAAFVRPALERFGPRETLEFFHGLGLLTVEEYGGRVYPYSNAANSVLDVLRSALERAGVELRCSCPAREIRRAGGGYDVVTDEETFTADALIVACGGCAGAKLGGVKDGYELLKPLGHKRTALYPALVQLVTAPEYPRALKGVRCPAQLELKAGETVLARSEGELQFTETGVSGPAVFDLSRAAATGGEGLAVHIRLLPLSGAELAAALAERAEILGALPTSEIFTGLLHNRLGRMVVKYGGVPLEKTVAALTETERAKLAAACLDFTLPVRGTEDFDHAQVTAGGIRTAGFNPETLESWFMPNLFVCGELLDVDGDCGGFNLQWAWSSGHLAGRLGR